MAGGEAEATIVTKVVKDLLGDAAEGVAKDGAEDLAKDGAENLAKDGVEDLGKDAVDDTGRDAADAASRETSDPLKDGEGGTPPEDRTATKDPIDVATGEVLLSQTDVTLPGVLPLVLERTHVSSYRQGGLFGVSWASTLDQRLEVSADGVWHAAPDGTIAAYPPVLMVGVSMAPTNGPLRPLTSTADGYTIHDPKTGRTLHFPSPGGDHGWSPPLVALTDRHGNRIDLVRDDSGDLREIRHSGGYRVGVEIDRGRVTELRLLNAADRPVLKRFGYDGAGRLTEVYNGSADRPTRFEYDAAGRMTRWTDTNGHWYAYTYDEQGRAVAGEGPGGYLSTRLTYHDRSTVVTDSLGHATTYHLNERRQISAVADPLGNTTWTERDPRGLVLSRTDPLGRTTRYGYDEAGNLTAVTRPDGARIEVAYNGLGLPTGILDPDGTQWRFAYDEQGNLVTVADPIGAATAYAYDERGGLSAVTDPVGNTTTVTTNAAGLPVRVRDPLGGDTRYDRDDLGRVSAVVDGTGNRSVYRWTIEGKLAHRELADGTSESWIYECEGNSIEYVDAAGRTTRNEVTYFDLRSAQVDPDGARTEFGHDTELRLTLVTNPQGLTWQYEYDPAGRLIREVDFDGRVLTHAYDPAGQLVERVNGIGQSTHYAWDVLGNMVEKTSDGAHATFAYDMANRLVRAVNAEAQVEFRRDALGQVVAEVCNGRVLASAYDLAGRRVRRRTPTGTEAVWRYDRAGRHVALWMSGQELRFEYDGIGREVRRRIGAGAILDQRWGVDQRLSSQTLWGAPRPAAAGEPVGEARLLQHRGYSFGPDGTVDGIADRRRGTRRLDIDDRRKVTRVHGPDWSEQYTYDSSWNLVYATWPLTGEAATDDAVGTREYSGTRVHRAGAVRYEYDAQGRVVLRQHRRPSAKPWTWRYEWDADDRLGAVTTPDGGRWRYRYDALGRRIAKQFLGVEGRSVVHQVDFVWDDVVLAEQIHTQWRPDGVVSDTTTWEYEPGGFRPLVQVERTPLRDAPQQWVDREFYAIVSDIAGAPTELVDPSGDLVWEARSTLWGSGQTASAGRASCPLRFPGQYHDRETGLNYNYQRYYDPAIARYVSDDPIGLRGGPDPHAYVPNPLHWIDPLGLSACRTFTSDDPYVADVANAIESKYPGHVIDVNDPLIGPDGKMITDLDVHTQNAVIQVKEGNARGIVGQMDRTVAGQSKPVIAYIPDAKPGTVRALQRAGHLVTQNLGDLVSVVAP